MKKLIFITLLGIFFVAPIPVEAQILKKLKKKVEKRVDRNIDKTIDKGLDETEDAIKGKKVDTLSGKKNQRTKY
jgi:hypothetical protein